MTEPETPPQDTEESQRAPLTDREIQRLASEAQLDERLNADARQVGLREPDIRQFARATQRIPLRLAGAIDQRTRELAAASAFKRRARRLMLATLALLVVVGAGLAVAAYLDGSLGSNNPTLVRGGTVGLTILFGLTGWSVVLSQRANISHRQARAAHLQAALEVDKYRIEAVKRAIRAEINARAHQQYRTTMVDVESEGLAEVEDLDQLIDTPASERLEHLLETMPGGSIGISGARGIGKSSLIRTTCPSGDDQPAGLLGVIIPAPVEFDAREFILHLFAELCRAVVGREEVEHLRSPEPVLRAAGNVRTRVLLMAVGIILAAAGGVLIVVDLGTIDENVVWGGGLIVAGYALAVFPLLQRFLARASRPRGLSMSEHDPRFGKEIVDEARRRLTDVWFQQSFTSGWSGSIALPIGIEGGAEGSRELARQQMSMPDIVGELRRLVAALTSERFRGRAGGNVEVRIGIDELDKIDSLEHASRFMNEVKVLFGMKRCFFLLSVSEDAMSQFERRGLPLRDVFDSSFDDVVRVEPLSSERSVAMLRERTLGMPVPFMLLCHCMGGGLPRDVIRMAREMLRVQRLLVAGGDEAAGPGPGARSAPEKLGAVCAALVAGQVEAKIDATVVALRRLDPTPELDDFQTWLEESRRGPTTAPCLLAICAKPGLAVRRLIDSRSQPANGSHVQERPNELATELLTYLYFCAAVQEFFVDDRPTAEFREAMEAKPGALGDALATAHQAFASHPRAAWKATSEVRTQIGGSPIAFPRPRWGHLRRLRRSQGSIPR